jgi:hypothetical protein
MQANTIYRHHRGQFYIILHIGINPETNEDLVIYRTLKEENAQIWVSPESMFHENIEYKGVYVPRFVLMNSKI